jgi:predicted SnoaL-like aldol condensation-catalyzing enzyme
MTNKEAAAEFLKLVTDGRVDEAYERFVDMGGRHHNAYTPAGFEALKRGMKESDQQFPGKQFKVRRLIGEGDLVAAHSELHFQPGDTGLAVVHLFRFENGKIVEFWDVPQMLPESNPNRDGAF